LVPGDRGGVDQQLVDPDRGTPVVELVDVQPHGRPVVAAGDVGAYPDHPYPHAAGPPADVTGRQDEDVVGAGYRHRWRVDEPVQARIRVAEQHRGTSPSTSRRE